ncbi:hypothetical protein C8R43DRAFT_955214 [Mycena crocata]|nr:hypothetical protein C8R43DRAFT_955214 [Mycena crocata]
MVIIRKAAYATRNPGKAVQPSRKRAKKGDAATGTAALDAAKRLQRKIKFDDAIDGFWDYRTAEITRIAKDCHKSESVVRSMLCSSSLWKPTRRPTLKNTVIHDRSVKAKDEGRPSHECKLKYLQQELQEEIEDSDCDDFSSWALATIDADENKRLMEQLTEHRELMARGVRGSRKAALMDGRQTANRIGDEVRLSRRTPSSWTGIRGFAMFSRGHPDDPSLPHRCDSDEALEFFAQVLGISSLDVIRRFEQWSCAQDDGTKERNDINSVRKEFVRLVVEGLHELGHNYEVDVRERLAVELAGWPTDIPMVRPAKMVLESARRIRDMLRTGTIHWVALTKAQHVELVKKHNHIRAASATGQIKTRGPRSDKGRKRGARKVIKGKAKAVSHNSDDEEEEEDNDEEEEDDDEEDDEDEEDEEDEDEDEEPSPSSSSRRIKNPTAAAPTAIPATSASSFALTPVLHAPAISTPAFAASTGMDVDGPAMDIDGTDRLVIGEGLDEFGLPLAGWGTGGIGEGGFGDNFDYDFDFGQLDMSRLSLEPSSGQEEFPPTDVLAGTIFARDAAAPAPAAFTFPQPMPSSAPASSTSVFAVTTNTASTAGVKRTRTSSDEDDKMPMPMQKKARKPRSDKGKKRGENSDSMPAEKKARKPRSDKGKKRPAVA